MASQAASCAAQSQHTLPEMSDLKRLSCLIKEGDIQGVLDHLKECCITPDSYLKVQDQILKSELESVATPVALAASTGNVDLVNKLVSLGFDPNEKSIAYCQLRPIHFATVEGHMDVLRALVREHLVDLDSLDSRDQSALHWAVTKNRMNVVQFLVEAGASINRKYTRRKITLLHTAVDLRDADICKYLIANGANVNAYDFAWCTPLHMAVYMKRIPHIRALLEAGAAVNEFNCMGETPLFCAAKVGDAELLRLLCSEGADVNLANNEWNSPLHEAIGNLNYTTARFLVVEAGASLDCRDIDDYTPLSLAVFCGFEEVIDLILNVGYCPKQEELEHDPQVVPSQERTRLLRCIRDIVSSPRTLQSMCCIQIRRILDHRLASSVDVLPLPEIVKDMLMLVCPHRVTDRY